MVPSRAIRVLDDFEDMPILLAFLPDSVKWKIVFDNVGGFGKVRSKCDTIGSTLITFDAIASDVTRFDFVELHYITLHRIR